MSARSAHQILPTLGTSEFEVALKRADALRRGELAGMTDDEAPLLRYLAAELNHLDVVRAQTAAIAASLNPA